MSLYGYIRPDTSLIPLAPRIRTQDEITPESIKKAMRNWGQHVDRMDRLYSYYVGAVSPIMEPGDDPGDSRTLANYCEYITKTLKGYIIGNQTVYRAGQDDALGQEIIDLFERQNKHQADADLIQDLLIYGRAFELVYLSDDGKVKSTVISPKDAFVAYAGTVEEDSIFGAVRYSVPLDDGRVRHTLYLYDTVNRSVWESYSGGESDAWAQVDEFRPHGFGRVPLIEYRRNREYTGVFEGIIGLQNEYNRLLCNRIADKDAFVKSILLLVGSVIGHTPEEIADSMAKLKKGRVLQMDEDGQASFLEHSLDETQAQILADALKNDIHKFAACPDLSDEQFSSNASGVAMAYKLFGTDQIVSEIIVNFQAGFNRRCKLYDYRMNNAVSAGSYSGADVDNMEVIFRFNSPQDLSYLSQSLASLVQSRIISLDTARRQLPIVTDAEAEAEKVAEEMAGQADIEASAFLSDPFITQGQE